MKVTRTFFLLLLTAALLPCGLRAQKLLASFENENDVTGINTTDGVQLAWSTAFPALAAHSVKTVFPQQGGSMQLTGLPIRNWSRHQVLLFFIWSNNRTSIDVTIQDTLQHTATKSFPVKQGANHIQVRLSELKNLNLEGVSSLGIRTKQAAEFYLDYVALDQYQPVLANNGRWDIRYSTKVKTTHFPWAAPFAGGKIKTYSIAPVFDGRGIIELAERLDLDFKTTSIGRDGGDNRWGFGDFYDRRNPLDHDEGKPFGLAHNYITDDLLYSPEVDVIIWPGLHPWESYPEPLRNALLKRVEEGTGLLLLYPNSDSVNNSSLWDLSPLKRAETGNLKDVEWPERVKPFLDTTKWRTTGSHYITRGLALEAFPWGRIGALRYENNKGEILLKTDSGNPVLAVGTYGKGRVVAMAYPEKAFIPQLDNPWETGHRYPYWEYMWSMVARSVIWASEKEPQAAIKSAARTADGIHVGLTKVPQGAFLAVQVQDAFGIAEQELRIPLTQNQSTATIKLKKGLNGGSHIANIQLKGANGVHDWWSLPFQVAQPAQIAAIQNRETEIPIGQDVHTIVVLKAEAPVQGTLAARLFDNHGRLVSEQTQPVSFEGEKSYPVVFASKGILTHLGRTDFVLRINGNQADRKAAELFFLQPRKWDDYDITMYHFGPDPVPGTWPAIDTQLQQIHMTTMAAYTLDNSKHANYKVQAQTRIHGMESPDNGPDLEYYNAMKQKYLETGDKRVLVRKYGLNDSGYLRSVRELLQARIPAWRKFSPTAYYIYEEPSVTRYDDPLDLDFSETSLAAFRQWLSQKYSSLQALNTQWGTAFNRWEDVVPDDSKEAQQRGNYSSWADHRSFMEWSWADQFRFVQGIVNDLDPGGLVQLSGTQASGSHNGYDYSQINKYVGQMNPYDIGNQLEYHLTFNPKLKVSGQAGYGLLGKDVLYDLYQHVFLKETGGAYIFWQQSTLNPDLTLCQSGLDMKAGFDELRGAGIGKLISSFIPENEARIAIHYSYPSIHGTWIVDGKISGSKSYEPGPGSETLRQFRRNLDGWVKVLHDAGLGFEFCAYSGIEDGDLISKGYKVLILPMSVALSEREVEQIEAFVKGGGILIADALPGIMDGHAKFRTKRALAEVFGIAPQAYTRQAMTTPKGETALQLAGTTPVEEDNNLERLYHTYGNGKAYLLNYFLEAYPEEKLTQSNEAALSKIRGLFSRENIQSGIVLTTASGKPASGIAKYALAENSGTTRLLGLLPDKNSTESVINLQLNKAAHLYDIRRKKDMGVGKSFRLKVEAAVPELFGLVQGTVKAINATAPAVVKRGENVSIPFQVSGSADLNLNSVARVDVFNPKGQKVSIYSDNFAINHNTGTFQFQTALNDPAGTWKVRITEVISGITKEIPISIQ